MAPRAMRAIGAAVNSASVQAGSTSWQNAARASLPSPDSSASIT